MGIVYEAIHVDIGRRVAIKRLHRNYTTDELIVSRFQQEARLAASIGHDNICEVTDIGKSKSGAPYLVMPLLSGSSMADLLESDDRPGIMRIVDIICQTLSALHAAHDAKIVHRDLKPDNIFITRVGDREDFVKLLDFGISKVINQESVSKLTKTGTVLGTPYYMAPEQARGAKNLDHRVDIYAMGVILYEAATGRRPFEGDTYNEVMFKILTEPFDAPRTVNPSIPASVEKVILKAMARDPVERYASAEEMRSALENAAVETMPGMGAFSTRASTAVGGSGPFTPTNVRRMMTPDSTAGVSVPDHPVTMSHADSGRKRVFVSLAVLLIILLVIIGGYFITTGGEAGADSGAQVPISTPSLPEKPAAAAKKVEQPPDVPEKKEPSLEPVAADSEEKARETDSVKPGAEDDKSSVKKSSRSSRRKKPSRRRSSRSKPSSENTGEEKSAKDDGRVKGRFRTSIVSDYDE